jgi:hypothetical protein
MIVAGVVIVLGLWVVLQPLRFAMMAPGSDVIPSGDRLDTVSTFE